MLKKELLGMKPLRATKTIMESAMNKPYHIETIDNQPVKYMYAIYMRCHIQENILKVAIYYTDHLRSGGRNPVYELFIDKKNERFITYDRLHDKWLDSKLDMLPFPVYVSSSQKNIWINKSDSNMIQKYLGSKTGGFEGLLKYQWNIRYKERIKRHRKETDKWDADLVQIPKLPKDWDNWVDKVGIRDNYIFYKYDKKGVHTGYCTFCGKEVPIKKPKYNKESACTRCRHKITFKSTGKAGTIFTKKYDMYLIQRCKDGFVIRYFQAYRKYSKGKYKEPEWISCSEIRRAIYGKDGTALRAYYWGLYKQQYTRWIATNICSPGFHGEEGKIYGKTIPNLAVNELSRTGLPEMLKRTELIDPEKYLAIFNEVPQIEKVIKAKLPYMLQECLSNYGEFRKSMYNPYANSLTEILGVNTQELKRLRNNNCGMRFLDWLKLERAANKIIRDDIIKWFCSEKIEPKDIQFIQDRMSIIQIYNYIKRQMSVYNISGKDIIIKWADYLSMAKRLKMDTNDEIVFRVNKLYQRHDELVEICHEKSIALQAEKILEDYPHIDAICESIKEKYEYADSDYTVLAPNRLEDIIYEGRNLHHCVADTERYWERIERRETYILFLRKSSDAGKSYYTLEIEPNGTIRQKRTLYDRQEPDIEDAKKFLAKWQEVVLKRITSEDKQLAEKSRILRYESYEKLRNDKVIIHTGTMAGKLLVDVLLADLMENAA